VIVGDHHADFFNAGHFSKLITGRRAENDYIEIGLGAEGLGLNDEKTILKTSCRGGIP
jgi:hypothetical protein